MSRRFEQEYIETNDRIHPREDLLREMGQKWAAEEARMAAERRKARAFPLWARVLATAAGVLLCFGVGMGSVMLYTRNQRMQNKLAAAERAETETLAAGAADMAAEAAMDETIVYDGVEAEAEADLEEAPMAEAAAPEEPKTLLAAAPTLAPPEGTHFAMDEAEVEDTVRRGLMDKGAAKAAAETKAVNAAEAQTVTYPKGKIIRRDDIYAVFMPTVEQVHVIEYANRKVTNVFSLTLRDGKGQIENLFWLGRELLALRTRGGETELQRFDVSDWKSPRHLVSLTQSGTLLGAWEMGGRLYILSLCQVTEQEPLPWVNGDRLDFDRVLLDEARPGDTYALIAVYEPDQGDGFAYANALLAPIEGAVDTGDDGLLLWTGSDSADLYVLALGAHGLNLMAESARPGAVLSAAGGGAGFSLLLREEGDVRYVSLDGALNERAAAAVQGAGSLRFGQAYEDGAVALTEDAVHFLTAAGDRTLNVTGDAFCWLTPDRGLVMSEDGTLQVVSLGENGPEALGNVRMRNADMKMLFEDLSRIAYDPDTGRLMIPAGQNVYPYAVDAAGKITLRGGIQTFYDHNEAEQRELRVLLFEGQSLLFFKYGVFVCNQYLEKLLNNRY